MGRIIVQVEISNPSDEGKTLTCSMFVDTGTAGLVLPMAWKERLGNFLSSEVVDLVLANDEELKGERCGPVSIQIEGFQRIFNEVIFMEKERTEESEYQGLLGYIILQQSQAALDMLGHRLVHVRLMDCR